MQMPQQEVTRVILGDDYYGYRMPVPSEFTPDMMADENEKLEVLESIGIPRREGVSPLAAWRDAVADETGIPREQLDPSKGGRFDGGFTPVYVRQFITFLV